MKGMIDLSRIHSLTDFLRNHKQFVDRLKASESPDVLTVNGRPELVIQSAAGYQELLSRLEYAENVAGLNVAIAQVKEGKVKPYDEALDEILKRRDL
jgi:PHD/YefM family antitoxin component YafN of YafNO toxin-antitoxin module